MNDEEKPTVSVVVPQEPVNTDTQTAAIETPTQPVEANQSGAWAPQAQYDARVTDAANLRATTISHDARLKAFYILLAIAGSSLFILYIGMLIWPLEYISKGNCSTGFAAIAFWLNPVSYLLLLATGIVGTTNRHPVVRPLGIAFIVLSGPAWFITGLIILGPILCGV